MPKSGNICHAWRPCRYQAGADATITEMRRHTFYLGQGYHVRCCELPAHRDIIEYHTHNPTLNFYETEK